MYGKEKTVRTFLLTKIFGGRELLRKADWKNHLIVVVCASGNGLGSAEVRPDLHPDCSWQIQKWPDCFLYGWAWMAQTTGDNQEKVIQLTSEGWAIPALGRYNNVLSATSRTPQWKSEEAEFWEQTLMPISGRRNSLSKLDQNVNKNNFNFFQIKKIWLFCSVIELTNIKVPLRY